MIRVKTDVTEMGRKSDVVGTGLKFT